MNIPRATQQLQIHKMADSEAHGEEEAIRDYFKKGFTYDEILALLGQYNDITMSIATFKRGIKEYGLKRDL